MYKSVLKKKCKSHILSLTIFNFDILNLKGDLLCKNHFYKLFEHSCVAAVCENNQPIMVKIHQLILL